MNDVLRALQPRLIEWASGKPSLRRLWIFGSRLTGKNRPDSDLDVCCEIDVLATQHAKDQWLTYEQRKWQSELSDICSLHVHLEPYATDQVKRFMAERSFLVYERAS